MQTNYRARLVGVFGCPIDENPTIVMQEAGFRALNLNFRYLNLLVEPGKLGAAFIGMRAMHFDGINLTVPHKVEAMKYVDLLTDKARLIGAINTVYLREGNLVGDNTDGAGFVAGMRKRGVDLSGKRIAVIGAGGASRAICVECALAGAASLVILNRTVDKARTIAGIVEKHTACRARAEAFVPGMKPPACDILVNATTIGLYPDPNAPDIDYGGIVPGLIVQDIIPNPADTPFLKKARERGAAAYDGLSMLVEQGAIAFELWTGEKAPVSVMYDALAREMAR